MMSVQDTAPARHGSCSNVQEACSSNRGQPCKLEGPASQPARLDEGLSHPDGELLPGPVRWRLNRAHRRRLLHDLPHLATRLVWSVKDDARSKPP